MFAQKRVNQQGEFSEISFIALHRCLPADF